MLDFVLRECRAVIDGPIVIIRLGTCGSIDLSISCGDPVVIDKSHSLVRNPDAFRKSTRESVSNIVGTGDGEMAYYHISSPAYADEKLTKIVF
jgi:uridine phosphorylase